MLFTQIAYEHGKIHTIKHPLDCRNATVTRPTTSLSETVSDVLAGNHLPSDLVLIGYWIYDCLYLQLKHILTGKFVHMSTTQTSQIDKNYMKVRANSRPSLN